MSNTINISGPMEGFTPNDYEYNVDLPIPITIEPTPPRPPFPPTPPIPPCPPKPHGIQGAQGEEVQEVFQV